MEKKRVRWSEEETIFFLELLKEKKILQVLDGKRFKASEVYKALEKEMEKSGYIKDATMMKTKFKNLKADYYKAKKHNSLSGVDPKHCAYFDILDELLGDRPAVTMEGVDTPLTQESEEEADIDQQEESEILQNTEDDSSREVEVPEGNFELSKDGYLSPLPAASPEGEPSTSDGREAISITPSTDQSKTSSTEQSKTSSAEQSKTPRSIGKNSTSSRNPTAVLLELKESIQESLTKLSEKEDKENEFLDKLLKGQSQLLKEMTKDFIEGIGTIFKKKKRKYYSSSTDSESEDEKRKRRK